ncbi:ubiquinol-cytochrome C chaperone family protein [Pelagibacteraceae bacterium]|nr:ubiquinol-cytochrome C chaperone family protein [Pelagibacteraceae bacterium]
MIFKFKRHNSSLYNTLLSLSRNIYFYKKIQLEDSFETRIYLIFLHFSIMMLIFKKKGKKFSQESYDSLFYNVENNLRELGFGDVSVNKKMKDFNKILYDILLKIDKNTGNQFILNEKLIFKYFKDFNDKKVEKYNEFETYFTNFYNFCFELSLDNMIREAIKFKKNYGSS